MSEQIKQLTAREFVSGYCERSGISQEEFYGRSVPLPDRTSPCGWAKVSNNPRSIQDHIELYSPFPDDVFAPYAETENTYGYAMHNNRTIMFEGGYGVTIEGEGVSNVSFFIHSPAAPTDQRLEPGERRAPIAYTLPVHPDDDEFVSVKKSVLNNAHAIVIHCYMMRSRDALWERALDLDYVLRKILRGGGGGPAPVAAGLSAGELRFLEYIALNPGAKLNDGIALEDEGNSLWKRLEDLGMIECVGSYKWKLTFNAVEVGVKSFLGQRPPPVTVVMRCSFCDVVNEHGSPWSCHSESVDGNLVYRVIGCKDHTHLVDACLDELNRPNPSL